MPDTPVKSFPADLEAAVGAVRNGGIVALPYERLFGLAANALDPKAVERVAAIKGRGLSGGGFQPISVIAADIDAARGVAGDFTPLAGLLAEKYWPGPLTILVRGKPGLPAELLGPTGLIGIRVPGPCPAAELAARSGKVLTATSANRHGGADALCHDDVQGLEGVDMIIAGSVAGPPGSTVVDASGNRPVVLRAGIVVLEETPK